MVSKAGVAYVPTEIESDLPADTSEMELRQAGWRRGWNVLEVRTRPGGLVLEEIRTGSGP